MKVEWRWILLFVVGLAASALLLRLLSDPLPEIPLESPFKAVPITFEIRKAEPIPAAGWKEFTVRGSKQTIYLHPDAELTSADIRRVMPVRGEGGSGPAITLQLTRDGARKMRKLSAGHLGKQLAIMIDGEVVMAPRVSEVLSEHLMISGLEQREVDDFVRGFPPQREEPDLPGTR